MEKNDTRLIIDCKNLDSNPHCPHGPTLLYQRLSNGKETKKHYACSAYQNRNDCSFVFGSRTVEESKRQIVIKERKRIFPYDITQLGKRLERLKDVEPSSRLFCVTCSTLIFSNEQNEHIGHILKNDITDHLLTHPSQLLILHSDSKREAQFMFSENTVEVILGGLKALNFKKLICMGTPTIHERIMENKDEMESIFLDIDHRYIQFYRNDKFCWFNMMNCFPMKGHNTFDKITDFLHSDNVALLMDPPFSARPEPLHYTLSKLNSIYQQQIRENDNNLPVVWIFPYFKENDVLTAWPGMVMLDYDVKYTNHKKFDKSDKTSVIRIFTNLDASKFAFPMSEGYRYCKKCKRWVSRHNKHCFKCRMCPSKNGQPYKHCDLCSRCIKHSWEHCYKCGRCALPKHPCQMWQTKNVQIVLPTRENFVPARNAMKRALIPSPSSVKKRKK